jgi:hypothetical protein
MAEMAPKVTLIMAVYNGGRFLRETLDSLLGQTFSDFELIVVDDASTDNSVAIIRDYTDIRIRFFQNPENIGMHATRNLALGLAQGIYVTNNDQDDIALPNRLTRQVAILDNEPNVGVVGAWVQGIDEAGKRLEVLKLPTEPDHIAWTLCFNSAFSHSAVMYRRGLALTVGGYGQAETTADDYLLWTKLAPATQMKNLPEVLSLIRVHPEAVTATHLSQNVQAGSDISKAYVEKLLGESLHPGVPEMLTRTGYAHGGAQVFFQGIGAMQKLYRLFLRRNLSVQSRKRIQADFITRLLLMIPLRLVRCLPGRGGEATSYFQRAALRYNLLYQAALCWSGKGATADV